MKYCIVYNLHFDERLGTWFPSAFIVEQDEEGKLRYMDRVANMDTLSTFGSELNETVSYTHLVTMYIPPPKSAVLSVSKQSFKIKLATPPRG